MERNLDPLSIMRCAIDVLKKEIEVNYRFIEHTHSSDENHACFINSMEVHKKHPSFWTNRRPQFVHFLCKILAWMMCLNDLQQISTTFRSYDQHFTHIKLLANFKFEFWLYRRNQGTKSLISLQWKWQLNLNYYWLTERVATSRRLIYWRVLRDTFNQVILKIIRRTKT